MIQVRDDGVWQAHRSDLLALGDTGVAFLKFIELWVELADEVIAAKGWTPDEALRQTLVTAEVTEGRVSANMMGQMLLVIANHWVHGEEMISGLTPLERRVFDDYLVLAVDSQESGEP